MISKVQRDHKGSALYAGNEYSFTTGQFARLDKSYRRHCGPTAVTNLLFMLARLEGRPITEKPEEVFQKVAGIGGKRLLYWNTDLLKWFGGTSDLLAPLFIRSCLRQYGLTSYRVRGPFPATAKRMKLCIPYAEGSFLQLLREEGKLFSEAYTPEGTLVDVMVDVRRQKRAEGYAVKNE